MYSVGAVSLRSEQLIVAQRFKSADHISPSLCTTETLWTGKSRGTLQNVLLKENMENMF